MLSSLNINIILVSPQVLFTLVIYLLYLHTYLLTLKTVLKTKRYTIKTIKI